MDDNQNPQKPSETKAAKVVTTTVTCPHCGKSHEVTVEVPEEQGSTKVIWED